MPRATPKKRARSNPNFSEQALGIVGNGRSQAFDFISNLAARTGFGTSSLENGTSYEITRWSLNYWSVISVFETSWIARRICTAPAEDVVKSWPTVHSDADPKDLAKIDKAIRKTNTKNQLLEGLIWGRLFGGAGALIVIKGDENRLDEPLDLDKIELGSYKGLSIFDRWSGITPSAETCEDIDRPLDFGKPEFYDCGGKGSASQRVHSSRILRFTGPIMPEPEKSAYSGWGISVLAPVIQTITSFDTVSANALSLSFRAQLIGMTIPDLEQMLSGLGATQGKSTSAAQRFASRMQQINELMSNQSMILLPKDGSLTTTNYSFSGLYELMQSFQLQVAGAAKMPVSLLWGRTLNGLGQTGDGDEKLYEKTIATECDTTLRPALEKLYPVIATSELGEVPDDMELDFPSIRVLTEQEKAELAKSSVDAITVCINTGIMSPRTGAKEVKQQSTVTGFGTNLTDEEIDKLSEDVQAEGELGEGLFGEEGGKTLDPSGSPTAALKETDKLTGQKKPQNAPGKTVGAPKVPLDEDPDDVKPVPTAAAAAAAAEKAKAADMGGYYTSTDITRWLTVLKAEGVRVKFNYVVQSGSAPPNDQSMGYKNYEVDFNVNNETRRAYKVAKSIVDAKHEVLVDLMMRVDIDKKNKGIARDEDSPGQTRMVHGLECVIETPKGDVRSGPGWETVMPYDYGYIKGVTGADGDSLDVAIGPGQGNGWVYLMDQKHLKPRTGFDETKCFLNWPSCRAALDAFKAGHHRADEVMMDWTPMSVASFLQWLKTGNLKRPASEQ